MTPINYLPQTSYFLYEGVMRKCNHNIMTKGYAPRLQGYRICCTCYQVVWCCLDDLQYMTNGKYDEDKIRLSVQNLL